MFTLLMALVACTDMESVPSVEPDIIEHADELNFVADGLDDSNYIFVTEEEGMNFLYVDGELWARMQLELYGLQLVGYGLETSEDWQNGLIGTVDLDGYTWAKFRVPNDGDPAKLRLAVSVIGADEICDGDNWQLCWWNLPGFVDDDMGLWDYHCEGVDTEDNWVMNVGMEIRPDGSFAPRDDNCGLDYDEAHEDEYSEQRDEFYKKHFGMPYLEYLTIREQRLELAELLDS